MPKSFPLSLYGSWSCCSMIAFIMARLIRMSSRVRCWLLQDQTIVTQQAVHRIDENIINQFRVQAWATTLEKSNSAGPQKTRRINRRSRSYSIRSILQRLAYA